LVTIFTKFFAAALDLSNVETVRKA